MADNVTLNTNTTTGDTVATEDISGVEYQKVKLVDGTPTSTTAIPLSGDLSNGLDVDVTRVQGTVTVDNSGQTQPVSGTVTANLSATDNSVLDSIDAATTAIKTAVELLDNTVSGSELQVDIVSGSSSGTEYTEDAAAAADPVGPVKILVREDAPVSVAADGDNVAQRGTAYGAGYVQVVDSSGNFVDSFGGSGGTSSADDADFVATSTLGTIVQGVYESSPTSVTDGDVGAIGINVNRAVLVDGSAVTQPISGTVSLSAVDNAVLDTLVTSNAAIQTAVEILDNAISGSEMQVDIVSGGTGSTQYAEDSVHTTGDTGTQVLAVRNDVLAALANADGDYAPLQVDASGGLYVAGTVTCELSSVDNAVLDVIASDTSSLDSKVTACDTGAVVVSSGAITATLSSVDNAVLDVIASDTSSLDSKITACDTGSVVISSGSVTASLSATDNAVLDAVAASVASIDANLGGTHIDDAAFTAGTSDGVPVFGIVSTDSVDSGDAGALRMSPDRALVVRPHTELENVLSNRVADTGGTSTAFSNFGAGGAGIHNYVTSVTVWNSSGTAGFVDLRDGTGGSVIATVGANASGGQTVTFSPPLKGAANTALAYDVSGALSTFYITVVGFQAAG